MNYTDSVTVTRRAVTGTSDGLVSVAAVTVLADVPCAVSPVSAAQVADAFGAGVVPLDVSKERAFFYLPDWAGTVPEPRQPLASYGFTTSDGATWQTEALLHGVGYVRFLVWRVSY